MNEEVKVGDIICESYGYSMVLFRFHKVIKTSDKSIWLQRLENKVTGETTDCFRPWVVAGDAKQDEPIRCVRRNSYIGYVWNGKPVQEDHLD